jgi:hypothetical protein
MKTHLVRLDQDGKQLVRIVCGCVEVAPIGGYFRLLAATVPYTPGPVILPRRYTDMETARADCDLLNNEEHPCSLPVRESQHTIPSTIGAGYDL